jgi:mono/diheme cytochrome c family protein
MAAVVAGVLCIPVAMAAEEGGSETKIKCDANGQNCKVSKDIYIGWRTFNGNCARCHGETAAGSTFAPSLFERMENMPEPAFKAIVMGGMKGQVGVMPAFGNDGNVMPYMDELWAYLNALTTKKIPPGRPQELEDSGQQVPEYLREKQGG